MTESMQRAKHVLSLIDEFTGKLETFWPDDEMKENERPIYDALGEVIFTMYMYRARVNLEIAKNGVRSDT